MPSALDRLRAARAARAAPSALDRLRAQQAARAAPRAAVAPQQARRDTRPAVARSSKRGGRPEWATKPTNPHKLEARVVEVLHRRRRQMLIHSCIYYCLDDALVSDHRWQRWATQLARLQDKFGYEIGFYDEAFADWDGSSGYRLPFCADVMRVARRLIDHRRNTEALL